MSQDRKKNYTMIGVIGIIVILLLLIIAGKKRTATQTSNPESEKIITTQNEFAVNNELNSVTDISNTTNNKFNLSLSSPLNGSTVKSAEIQVVGKTVPDADVFVNEIDAKADKNGNFSVKYTLEEGENYLVVGANDDQGNFQETDLTVIREI